MKIEPLDLVNSGVFSLFALLGLVGAVLCLVYRRLSPWLTLAMVGFLGWAGATLLRIVLTHAFNALEVWSGVMRPIQFFLVMNTLGVGFTLLIVVGLALAFPDIQRKLRRSREEADQVNRPALTPETREDWRSPAKGSH